MREIEQYTRRLELRGYDDVRTRAAVHTLRCMRLPRTIEPVEVVAALRAACRAWGRGPAMTRLESLLAAWCRSTDAQYTWQPCGREDREPDAPRGVNRAPLWEA